MCSICETLLSMPDKRRNRSPTIQLSIKRNAMSRLRSHNGWRCGCNLRVCFTVGWIFVVARQISARSSQWKNPHNFRYPDDPGILVARNLFREDEKQFSVRREEIRFRAPPIKGGFL